MNASTLSIIIYLSGLPKTQNSKEKYIKNTKNKHKIKEEDEIYNNTNFQQSIVILEYKYYN